MLRYILLLIVACAALYGSVVMDQKFHDWRTAPTRTVSTPAVSELANTPMPADAIDLQETSGKLTELGQTRLLEAISLYMRYQVLARMLGLTPDAVPTVNALTAWADANPDRTQALEREAITTSLAIALAAPDVAPPKAGRDGRNYNLPFAPLGDGVWQELAANGDASTATARVLYFVVNVKNLLANTPLQTFDFYAVPIEQNGTPALLPLPERSYLWCSHHAMAGAANGLTAGQSMALLCEVRGGGVAPLQASDVASILNGIRSGTRQLVPWVKQLELVLPAGHAVSSLQLSDRGVSAEFGHPPSANVDTGFVATPQPSNGLPKYRGRLTTCEDRGDCLQTRLAPFEGIASDAEVVLPGVIVGLLLAGLLHATSRDGSAKRKAMVPLVALTLLAFPVAYSMGGTGWGPLGALLITAGLAGGFWAGWLLAWLALRAR